MDRAHAFRSPVRSEREVIFYIPKANYRFSASRNSATRSFSESLSNLYGALFRSAAKRSLCAVRQLAPCDLVSITTTSAACFMRSSLLKAGYTSFSLGSETTPSPLIALAQTRSRALRGTCSSSGSADTKASASSIWDRLTTIRSAPRHIPGATIHRVPMKSTRFVAIGLRRHPPNPSEGA